MLFNTYSFALFFLIVLLLHYAPWFSWRMKKANLLWASYLFYAAWSPPFVLLLWLSTVVDWFVARRIYASEQKNRRRLWLMLSLGVNLGMLGFFKYGDFLLENFTLLMATAGISYQPLPMDIILPVGISFYTFQTLSYTLDVYWGKMKPWDSFLDFALFVTFFPQLVAGPIVRARTFLPQCQVWHRPSADQMGWGLSLMLLGVFQKVVVADGLLAPYVEQIYDGGHAVGQMAAWAGTLAFAGQIFCDFAGYSTTAIGAAMCLGFSLPDNFRFPYAAVGFSDFWQRWHISLSSWLRDYLYIPLGGNRRGYVRTKINLMLTMLIGGLWHGAAWNFVIWGGMHGSFLVAEHWLRDNLQDRRYWQWPSVKLLLGMLTFALVCLTWVFFRAHDPGTALDLSGAMLGIGAGDYDLTRRDLAIILLTVGTLVGMHVLLRKTTLEDEARKIPSWLKSVLLAGMVISIVMMPGEDRAFIYFQF